ncbi:hypothetical protein SAMN04488513_102241 [Pseudozobellia thermophila]|uniref:Uncharacterized protein n=1 Tax=Pseudozobellia thermophila TaxID=192903 RepID=A0A1M6EZL4_9FLAO|nr:hypothetical protein SAMN04488513_102241 [Pseudozobellia thermophila]
MRRQHSVLVSFICVLVALCIWAPSLTKLGHALYEHQRLDCDQTNALHIHEAQLDCDFQKFQLSPQVLAALFSYTKLLPPTIARSDFNFYFFLNKYQKLQFVLRGPPYISYL